MNVRFGDAVLYIGGNWEGGIVNDDIIGAMKNNFKNRIAME